MKFMLTKRTIFDRVEQHLLRQNEKATNGMTDEGMPSCKYRTERGLKCAAGILILDEHYDEDFEGKNIRGQAVKDALMRSGIDLESQDTFHMIDKLQQIHDNLEPQYWAASLEKLKAETFG